MGVDQETERAARRKREKRFRRFLITVQVLAFLIPIALCIVLLYQMKLMEDKLTELTTGFETVAGMLERPQEDVSGGQSGQGNGTAPAVNSAKPGTPSEQLSQGKEEEGQEQTNASGDKGEDKTAEKPQAGERLPEAAHKVYLTFDDGPSVYTEEILDILDEYDVKATFFVLGKEDEDSIGRLQDIVDRGHTLGMHSYSHSYEGIYSSVENFAADFMKLQDFLFGATGVKSEFYRFPGGSSNAVSQVDMKEFAGYLKTQNVSYFDWNVSSGDGGSQQVSVETLVENCTKGITDRGTNVVLMHDSAGKRTTVEALPLIIEKLQSMEDTELLPITSETKLVQHLSWD